MTQPTCETYFLKVIVENLVEKLYIFAGIQSEEIVVDMSKTILLTGAGFTHNFGGLLAEGMWAIIFNHPEVQKQAYVRKLMIEDFDYESIYHKVLKANRIEGIFGKEDTSAEDKVAIRAAVFEAYRHLDNRILSPSSPCPNIYKVNELIERFASDRSEKSFFFTLNQDLFIERWFDPSAKCKPFSYPGINGMIPSRASGIKKRSPLERKDFIRLPNEKDIVEAKSVFASSKDFYYIKLHGSYGWNSSDGSDTLVIGQDKADSIAKEPLLSWYLEIFKNSLNQNDVKLLTIGYGFRDDHINKIIADSGRTYGLKLYVISPEGPREFIGKMPKTEVGQLIINKLCGYFQYALLQIFPEDQLITEDYRKIISSLFC